MRVKKFEDNATKIRSHYRKMNTHVRKYGAGEYGRQSQKLLNELAKAMLCLTDAKRKREYDASLGRTDFGSGKVRSFEEILLGNKLIDSEQLKKARNYANAVGLEVRDAVLQQKLAEPEEVMMAYAESQGLPFIDLEDVQIDERLVPQIAPDTARSHSCIPFMIDGERLLMLSPNPILPDVEEELRLRFNKPVRTVLCTPKSINARIEKYYPPGAVQAETASAATTGRGKTEGGTGGSLDARGDQGAADARGEGGAVEEDTRHFLLRDRHVGDDRHASGRIVAVRGDGRRGRCRRGSPRRLLPS